ncbi:MAG: hypothetical protein IJ385_03275 [Ruminiclostridium sp.]|nr:hypothetical protein [Ruminiclostridium sp.]
MNTLKKAGTICGAIAFLLMPLASVIIIVSWFYGWTVDKSDTVPAMSLVIISIMSAIILFLAVVDIISFVFFTISAKNRIKALGIISESIGLLSNLLFSGLYLFICHSSELYRTMTIIYFAVTAVLHVISLLSANLPEKINE